MELLSYFENLQFFANRSNDNRSMVQSQTHVFFPSQSKSGLPMVQFKNKFTKRRHLNLFEEYSTSINYTCRMLHEIKSYVFCGFEVLKNMISSGHKNYGSCNEKCILSSVSTTKTSLMLSKSVSDWFKRNKYTSFNAEETHCIGCTHIDDKITKIILVDYNWLQ